jgi:hypothetical protein
VQPNPLGSQNFLDWINISKKSKVAMEAWKTLALIEIQIVAIGSESMKFDDAT